MRRKKYKDPFSFVPSHTLVLYTNHLPKVGAIDAGTWRRLIVIPFNAKLKAPLTSRTMPTTFLTKLAVQS